MKRNKNIIRDLVLAFLGIGIVAVGFFIHQNVDTDHSFLSKSAYVFIALGCGLFGHFTGNVIKYFSLKDNEELERRLKIEQNDERNILIMEKSKARAYDLMIYLFAATLIIFSLMGIDKSAVLILVAIYLSLHLYSLYWRFKYEKEM